MSLNGTSRKYSCRVDRVHAAGGACRLDENVASSTVQIRFQGGCLKLLLFIDHPSFFRVLNSPEILPAIYSFAEFNVAFAGVFYATEHPQFQLVQPTFNLF